MAPDARLTLCDRRLRARSLPYTELAWHMGMMGMRDSCKAQRVSYMAGASSDDRQCWRDMGRNHSWLPLCAQGARRRGRTAGIVPHAMVVSMHAHSS